MLARPFKVLIADDSTDELRFLKRGLEQCPELALVAAVENGQAAIDYLGGNGGYADRERFPVPDLLLLDLNMPLVDGFGVLQWLQQRPVAGLQVVVLSNSD